MAGLFDYVNAINYSKIDLFDDEHKDQYKPSDYNKFIINRAMSYFPDTIAFANAANCKLQDIDDRSHFDFYRLAVDKKKRFSKWGKPIKQENLDLICKHYNYSIDKALDIMELMSNEDIEKLEKIYNHGGRSKR